MSNNWLKVFSRRSEEPEEDEVQTLVLEIESKVRQLSNLSDLPNTVPVDTVTVLRNINLLLDRLVKQSQYHNIPKATISEPIKIDTEPEIVSPEPEPPVVAIPTIERDPEPSSTARELIKLRDWILLASTENSTIDSKIFENLSQKLGQILAKEEVIALESDGKFNYEQQQAVDTKVTDDPNLDGVIYSTIRPGYSFNNRLIRPQEVIVYTLAEGKA